MGIGLVFNPKLQGRVHRILQSPAAVEDGNHFGPHPAHEEHVGELPVHVGFAHEDPGFQAEPGGRGRDGQSVLAGARLGDEARFSHFSGQERLAEDVIDLVSPGVGQTLHFQIDAASAARPAQVRGEIEGSRPPGVIAKKAVEFVSEFRVAAEMEEGFFELRQSRDEHFRNESSSIGAEISAPFMMAHGCFLSKVRRTASSGPDS